VTTKYTANAGYKGPDFLRSPVAVNVGSEKRNGVVRERREKATAVKRAHLIHTAEGQRPLTGYTCTKVRRVAGIRLALAKVKRLQRSKRMPL